MRDLYRFKGTGVHDLRSPNSCVAPGFACGINPALSESFRSCTKTEALPGDDISFVSSAVCFPASPGPHFYLAARLVDCTGIGCAAGQRWGVMDITDVPAPVAGPGKPPPDRDPPYLQFQAARRSALRAISLNGRSEAEYLTSVGRRVRFTLMAPTPAIAVFGPDVLAIDGVAVPTASTTGGGALQGDGRGRATLLGTGGPVTIDFSDASKPKRTP